MTNRTYNDVMLAIVDLARQYPDFDFSNILIIHYPDTNKYLAQYVRNDLPLSTVFSEEDTPYDALKNLIEDIRNGRAVFRGCLDYP